MFRKALVTGCAGFVGSHLCNALVLQGWSVIGIDSFMDNYDKGIKERNLSGLLSKPNFKFVGQDLMKVPLDRLIKKIDCIFHLAAQPGVRDSWGQQFDSYVINNVLATQRLLEAAKNIDMKKFVYASSSSVYGNTDILPVSEAHPTRPYSPYGVTKLAAENLCSLYYENYGVPVVSLRYFTVYGPRQRPDMGISSFINAILKGLNIVVYGDGNQKRDFTYVADVVSASILVAKSPVVGEVFNVGSGQPVALMEVIRILENLTGQRCRIEYIHSQRGDVRHTCADIRKISGMLGFRPSFELDRGLKEQVAYMKQLIRKR
jgi:UDP-glucose 4-epimerase